MDGLRRLRYLLCIASLFAAKDKPMSIVVSVAYVHSEKIKDRTAINLEFGFTFFVMQFGDCHFFTSLYFIHGRSSSKLKWLYCIVLSILILLSRNVCTRLRVAIYEVSGPSVFHIKVGASP